MNLVNMAMQYIGPAVAERIAAKMGVGGPVVNKLIAAALPALMGSMIGKSKSSSGLGAIMNLVTGDNRPQPNQLASAFDNGGDVDALVQSGGGMLEGLLGGQSIGALAGALGRHAGVEPSQAGSILGMLAGPAMGTIGNQVAEQGLDSAGLASFLGDQAGNVAQSMPAGFASELDGSGLFDGVMDNLGGIGGAATAAVGGAAAAASGAVGNVTGAASDAVSGMAESAQSTFAGATDRASAAVDTAQTSAKKGMGILPWFVIGAIVAALAWFFLGRDAEMPAVDTSAISAPDIMVGDVNVGEQFGTITGSLTDTFTGITDTASAEAALPQLEGLSGQIEGLSETVGGLSGTAQTGFQGIVGTALGTLRPIIDNAIAASGAGAILQPVVDKILGSLEGMAG